MNSFMVSSQFKLASRIADKFSLGLLGYIDERVEDLHKESANLTNPVSNSSDVVLPKVSKKNGSTTDGITFTEYRSNSRLLRVITNNPVGYVWGEIVQVCPPSRTSRRWAIKIEHDSCGHEVGKQVGSNLRVGTPVDARALADELLNELMTEQIDETMLRDSEYKALVIDK